jgi:predicted nucleic acid-binding protein
VILLDTTVLSNFARMERSDLLRLALPEAATTPQVMVELQEGVAAGHLPDCDWQWITVVTLTSEEEENLARVRLILDNGEASCIAVALARGGTLFSDDRDARRYVRRCGLCVSGTLGVLSLLVEREHLTVAEADAYLQKMIDQGYRSPIRSMADLGGTKK